MILYVDETECDDFFIVAGLLTTSREQTNLSYKKFKKSLNAVKISPKEKQRVFYEFKAVLLDRHYQKIKIKMLKEINKMDYQICYSAYIKKDRIFNQEQKEETYVFLLNKIVNAIKSDIDIIFDGFQKPDFENEIISKIKLNSNVLSIRSGESFDEEGLQFIDNICSSIRLHHSGKNHEFFELICDNVIEV